MPPRSARSSSRFDSGWLLACCVLSVVAIMLPDRVTDPVSATIRQTVLAPLIVAQRNAENVRATLVAREQALGLNGAAAAQALRTPGLEKENASLRALLGLAGTLRSGFVVAEAFHPPGLIDDFTLNVTAGSRAGVRRFSPIVTADGLVGMIQAVDPGSSLAITWAHPTFRVSAMAEDESAVGIVQPHLVSGAERYLLELRGVPFRASLDSGTLVVSSGRGPTYPRGIAIGTVISEIPTTERWARAYLLKPSVLMGDLSAVVVLLPERVALGVSTAWSDRSAVDTMAMAVVAASDSMAQAAARRTAMAELRARRDAEEAASDSARADSMLAPLGPMPGVRVPPTIAPRVTIPVRPDSARPDTTALVGWHS